MAPIASWTRSQLERSWTDEFTAPAAPTLSKSGHEMGTTPPSSLTCGVATLSRPTSCDVEVFVRDMPSGRKIREATNSSQDVPDTASTTSPAVMNMMFWYPKRLRRLEAGSSRWTRSTTSSRSNGERYQR